VPRAIHIPQQLRDASEEDDHALRLEWLATLPELIDEVAGAWELDLGTPYLPGGQCAWVAPVSDPAGNQLVLKVGWRHREAEHEADALRLLDGDGAVRCLATRSLPDTTALLLERCVPGTQLKDALDEPEQDRVLAGLIRRVHARRLPNGHPFRSLAEMSTHWAESFELDFATDPRGLDQALAADAAAAMRELPHSAERDVLLCTDLHAGNVLAAQREPWLIIDPKPYVGDPAYDPVQHLLNCRARLSADPHRLARRVAELIDAEPERVRLWLFARCAQEALHAPSLRDTARRLAP
jgi:streptomycin 6-kinase